MILVIVPFASCSPLLLEAREKLVEAFPPEERKGSLSPGSFDRNGPWKVDMACAFTGEETGNVRA
jgi:hypothetical protein